MKDIRTRLLLSAACFFLCLSIAAPVRAGKDAIRPRPPLPVNSEKVRAEQCGQVDESLGQVAFAGQCGLVLETACQYRRAES